MFEERSDTRHAEPLSAWVDLLAGRSCVIDQFDQAGRRFLVVRETQPPVSVADRALTMLEHRMLAFARHGHSNKRIAYELGIAESTLSSGLRAAAAKLGARSRLELVRLLGIADPPDPMGRP